VGATADKIALAEAGGRHLADPLDRVAKKRHVVSSAQFENVLPGLENTGFVVGGHHRDKAGPMPRQFLAQAGKRDGAVAFGGKPAHAKAEPADGGFQHRRMLEVGHPNFPIRRQGPTEMMENRVV